MRTAVRLMLVLLTLGVLWIRIQEVRTVSAGRHPSFLAGDGCSVR